jgi:nucleoside-diphosphate-sugar epimerase
VIRITHNERKAPVLRLPALVTGATSGLGRQLCTKLAGQGYEVRALVNPHRGGEQHPLNLPGHVTTYSADITLPNASDRKTLVGACSGVGTIFHAAGATFNHKFTFEQLKRINVGGTENLISAALEANRGNRNGIRFVYTSSVTVYGYRKPGHTITEGSKPDPRSDYSRSKLMAEQVVRHYAAGNPNISFTIMRLGTLYGPGYERPFFKVFKLIRDGKMRYVGKPTNHLTLVHVEDAADAEIDAAMSDAAAGKVYNVVDVVPHTEEELFELAAKYLKVSPPEKTIDRRIAMLMGNVTKVNKDEIEFLASDRIVSTHAIESELGFEPKRTIGVDGAKMVKEFIDKESNVG